MWIEVAVYRENCPFSLCLALTPPSFVCAEAGEGCVCVSVVEEQGLSLAARSADDCHPIALSHLVTWGSSLALLLRVSCSCQAGQKQDFIGRPNLNLGGALVGKQLTQNIQIYHKLQEKQAKVFSQLAGSVRVLVT